MRTRIILLVVLGLVFAATATFMVLKHTAQPQPQAQQAAVAMEPAGPATIEILVAMHDLPSGAIIGPTDVRPMPWPRGAVPEGGMLPDSIAFGQTVVRLPIARNSPVLMNQIVQKGEGGHLAYLLEEGRVAATIAITETAGVAGHVVPGDFVDILFTQSLGSSVAETLGAGGGSADTAATETLLVRIKVLAADLNLDDVNSEARVSRTVTLEVSPKEAEILALAQRIGSLSLSLNSATQPEVLDPAMALEVRRAPLKSFTLDNDISPLLQYARATAEASRQKEAEIKEAAAEHKAALQEAAAAEAAAVPAEAIEEEEEEARPHVVIVIRGNAAQEVSISPAKGTADEEGEAEAAEGSEKAKDGAKPSPIERSNSGETRQ